MYIVENVYTFVVCVALICGYNDIIMLYVTNNTTCEVNYNPNTLKTNVYILPND